MIGNAPISMRLAYSLDMPGLSLSCRTAANNLLRIPTPEWNYDEWQARAPASAKIVNSFRFHRVETTVWGAQAGSQPSCAVSRRTRIGSFQPRQPAGVREKSALMHDAQESNSAPPARPPSRPAGGSPRSGNKAAPRVVRPQEGGEASHPGRRTEGCTPAARRCREAPKLNPSLLDSIPTIAYSPKGPAQPRGVVARRSDDG